MGEIIGGFLLILQAFSGIVGGPRACIHDGKLAIRGPGETPVELGLGTPGVELVLIGKDCQR